MTHNAIEIGCVDESRKYAFREKVRKLEFASNTLKSVEFTPQDLQKLSIAVGQDGRRRTGFDVLSLNDVTFSDIRRAIPELSSVDSSTGEQVKRESTYFRYIERQNKELLSLKKDEEQRIPEHFNYEGIPGLSSELQVKLMEVKPSSLAHARRIDGMTPAALMLLLVHLRRTSKQKSA